MGFKIGDIIICIEPNKSDDSCSSLEFGGSYKVVDFSDWTPDLILINKVCADTSNSIQNNYAYSETRFIHENDWVKRMKYGV